jgi:YggT family protein
MLVGVLGTLLDILAFAIFIRAILSWFPVGAGNPVVTFFNWVTDPLIAPIRRVLPRTGMMDLSPMVAIVLIVGLRWLLGAVL